MINRYTTIKVGEWFCHFNQRNSPAEYLASQKNTNCQLLFLDNSLKNWEYSLQPPSFIILNTNWIFFCIFWYFGYLWSTYKFLRLHWNMSMHSRSNWNLDVLVFKERWKLKYTEKNLKEQGTEPTITSTNIWHQHQDSNLGHSGERRVPSPLHHPCSSSIDRVTKNFWSQGDSLYNLSGVILKILT